MSRRSIAILVVTGLLLVLLVVLLLVPAPEDNVGAIEAIVSRIEGALGILFPASAHTLFTDKKNGKTTDEEE